MNSIHVTQSASDAGEELPAVSSEAVPEDPKAATVASLYDWIEVAVFSLVCVTLVFSFLFRIVGVDGESMQYTLMNHDRLILTNLGYTPEHGDIVVIRQGTNEPLIKRVIALPGDSLQITEEGQVIRNGEVLQESYIHALTEPREFAGLDRVPDGYLFVMGDNRDNSLDSRFEQIGLIAIDRVMGKAVFRLWPLTSIGPVS